MPAPEPSAAFAAMFDDHLEVRPPLADEQLASIPARRGVFLLAGESGRPILLATAASIRARVRGRLDEAEAHQPKRSADLRAVTRAVHWKLAGGHFETDLAYLELARAIWPRGYAKLLSWRPAWFVHVDPSEPFPHLARTRDVFAAPGRYFGPFESGRSADRFVEVIQEAFDLCRDVQCLRRSPGAARCAYGQMGRCLCPCDGTISLDDYRRAVGQAAEFAAGRRQEHLRLLGERMRAVAAQLKFEQAAALKARRDRLGELDAPAYRHVAPAEDFRFVMIQPSGSRRSVRVFRVDRGAIQPDGPLRHPLVEAEVRAMLERMARFVAEGAGRPVDAADRWRIALVARALLAGGRQGGVALRWTRGMTVEAVSGAVGAAAGDLGLSAGRPV